MSKTLADLRTTTRSYLDEATTGDWLDAEVDDAINFAYHEVITAVVGTFEDYYITTDTLNSVASKQEYGSSDGLATDIYKIRRVEINYDPSDSSSTPSRALQINFDNVSRDLGNATIALTVSRAPAYYSYGFGSAMKIGFIPIPDEAGTDNIKVWYVAEQTDLSSATSVVNIPYADRYARLIPLAAAADLLRKGQQEETVAARYRLEFEAGLEKMQRELEDRLADDSKGVTDTVNADTSFEKPIIGGLY